MDTRFGVWKVRNLYGAGLLVTVAKEISKYKLDLVGVQEVSGNRGRVEPAGKHRLFCGKRNENVELDTVFLYIRQSYQHLKRVEVVVDRMLCIIVRGHWCDIIVLNAHAPAG
jgi:hypothetical protein